MGVGQQGGSLARADALNFDNIGVRTMQMGRGGTEIGDVGPGVIYQKPEAYIGPSSMDQKAKLDLTGGLNLLNLQGYQNASPMQIYVL